MPRTGRRILFLIAGRQYNILDSISPGAARALAGTHRLGTGRKHRDYAGKKKSEGPTLLVLHVRSPLEVPCHKTRADPLYLRLNPL